MVRALKSFMPETEIDFLTKNNYSDVYKFNNRINNLIEVNGDFSNSAETAEKVAQQKYDLVIDLQNNRRSARLLAGYKGEVIRYKKENFKKFLLVQTKINLLSAAPQIPVRYAGAIAANPKFAGFKPDDEGCEIMAPASTSEILSSPGKRFIAIAPGSQHFTKRWPAEYFGLLIEQLILRGDVPVLVGGESDREICDLLHREGKTLNFAGRNDLIRLARVIKDCSAIICNDSGLMHLAGAVGTPAAAIFGSTVKEFGFFPYKCKSTVIELPGLSCRPCSHIGRSSCPKEHFKCMNELTPMLVLHKLDKLMAA